MTDLLIQAINRSLSASWLILAVLALRILLRNAPKWIRPLLWGLVAIRLACPILPQSMLSLLPESEPVSPRIILDSTPGISTGIPAINQAVNPILSGSLTAVPGASANPLQIWLPILAAIWLIGVTALLLGALVSLLRLRRRIGTAIVLRKNILQSEAVPTPFVMGLIRPKIYLPFWIEEAALPYVIAHEKTHIRRGDPWWKALGFVLLAVYWFHPLLWVCYALFCRDIELACDEAVIRTMTPPQRADYSQALLCCSTGRPFFPACPLAFGETGIKGRIAAVLRYKKPALWAAVIAIATCAAAAAAFLPNPVQPSYHPEDNPIQSATVQWGEHPDRNLSAAQISELESRLRLLSGMRRSNEAEGLTPLYSLVVQTEDQTVWKFDNYSETRPLVFTQYEGKGYQITDPDFCDYLRRVCTGEDIAPAQPSASLPLTEQSAGDFIAATLRTLTLYEDGAVSFSLPGQIPSSGDPNTRLTISLSATYATDPGSYTIQRLLDWETGWQDGDSYRGQLDLTQGELEGLSMRVAFQTEVEEGLYQEFAANFLELHPPFSYGQPAAFSPPSVTITPQGRQTRLTYSLQDGTCFVLSLSLPDGLSLTRSADSDFGTPVLLLQQLEDTIGTISLYPFGSSDRETLESAVSPAEDLLPMPVFSPIALSNHAGYEDYQVRRSSDTGACATARYLWQDLQHSAGAAAEAPWLQADCVLAYDWSVLPYFVEIQTADGLLSQASLAALAESISLNPA
ncbi:MAG: hypothetical protein DBX44_07025 [Oscillospiraceae bacterium]|nr:MAG: hypothetical protein DBX44_07025 [Oscillospiraceae bacterium]